MRITICGSMDFSKEMLDLEARITKLGHEVVVPKGAEMHASGKISREDKWTKIEFDVFKAYFNEIKNSDAILVLNYSKKGIENYIGANSLIEMAFAHVLGKKIYLINPVPEMDYADEIVALKPIVIYGDISKIFK